MIDLDLQKNKLYREIELHAAQSEFLTNDTAKACLYLGGLGGGKSFVLVLKMIIMKLRYPETDVLYVMPTYSMFRDVMFPILHELLEGTNVVYEINKSTGEIFFGCGGRCILKSGDDPSRIVGMNVSHCFLDELDTLATEKARLVFLNSSARSRVRLPDGKLNTIQIASTPEGYRFLYQMFDKKKPDNYTLIKASSRLNPYLSEDYFDNIIATAPNEMVARAYIDGDFCQMTSGTVYTAFDREKSHCDSIYRDGETLYISVDFNVLNMNAVVYAEREPLNFPQSQYHGKKQWHAVAHLHNIADTPELITVVQNKYSRSPIYMYPDASGKNASSKGATVSDISMLRSAGFHVRAKSKNPRILDRVNSCNSALKTGLIKINTDLCPELMEALESQIYNPATELPAKTVGSSIDDVNDSFGYGIYYQFPLKRNGMSVIGTN